MRAWLRSSTRQYVGIITGTAGTVLAPRRCYAQTSNRETLINVPCGSNGHVELHIHGHCSDKIVVYLPTHAPAKIGHSKREAGYLAQCIGGTVVSIQYRLSRETHFPTPIHDVLFGYDWVLKHLVRRVLDDERTPRLGVVGSHLGGSLGAMLALTECKPWLPHVAAAALHEPVLDWTSLDADGWPRRNNQSYKRDHSGPSEQLSRVLEWRDTLFKKPVDYFDAFASPLLFFRTPGKSVPKHPPTGPHQEDFVDLAELDKLDFLRQQNKLAQVQNGLANDMVSSESALPAAEPSKLRRSSRRYPPNCSGLSLPNFHLSHTQHSVLRPMIEEFATHVRKSMVRDRRDCTQARLELDETVQVLSYDKQEMDIDRVATWLRKML